MVELLPSTATGDEERTYPQAQGMFWFLRRLCVGRAGCITQLPEALLEGQATPETLFEWVISERTRDRIAVSRRNSGVTTSRAANRSLQTPARSACVLGAGSRLSLSRMRRTSH